MSPQLQVWVKNTKPKGFFSPLAKEIGWGGGGGGRAETWEGKGAVKQLGRFPEISETSQ